jgi:NTE family protein
MVWAPAIRKSSTFLLVVLYVFTLQCLSQDPKNEQEQVQRRPKIGLAMSGGGARGLAHVGTMKWMEEHRVPIDYIAGTSIGALIGSAYSLGMSPSEMQEFVESIPWEEVMRAEPAYAEITFRLKEDRRQYPVAFPLGLKHKSISAPNGLNPGHGVGLLVDRMSLPAYAAADFEHLPIPFRCVATDMVSGTAVVLKSGSLSEALRASMSMPGFFTPVERDGMVLADGGLTNNIPTEVVREMGAEIVIALDVTTHLGGKPALTSIGGMLDESINVMTIDSDRRSLQLADIIIAPDLGSHSRKDFDAARKLIDLGYEATAKKAAVLLPFALPPDQWETYIATRRERRQKSPERLAGLEVTGIDGVLKSRVEAKLKPLLERDFDSRVVEHQLTHLTGEGRFDLVGYEAYPTAAGPLLRVRAHEKTYGPPFINTLLGVSGSDVGDFEFMAGIRLTFLDLGKLGAQWRSDFLLGSETLIGTEYYYPIAQSKVFIAPRLSFERGSRDFFSGDERSVEYRDTRMTAATDLGYASGQRSEVRFGFQISRAEFTPVIGQPLSLALDGYISQLRAGWVFDGHDSPTLPSRGLRISTQAHHFFTSPGTTNEFDQLEMQGSVFIPVSPKGSVFFMNSLGTTLNKNAAFLQQYRLGGMFRLGAYSFEALSGNHFIMGVAGYRREIMKLPNIVGQKVYAGGWYETGTAFMDLDHADLKHCFSGGIIADTILGPVAVSASASAEGKTRLRFSIGRLF